MKNTNSHLLQSHSQLNSILLLLFMLFVLMFLFMLVCLSGNNHFGLKSMRPDRTLKWFRETLRNLSRRVSSGTTLSSGTALGRQNYSWLRKPHAACTEKPAFIKKSVLCDTVGMPMQYRLLQSNTGARQKIRRPDKPAVRAHNAASVKQRHLPLWTALAYYDTLRYIARKLFWYDPEDLTV